MSQLEDHYENIDAAVFSGDMLFDDTQRSVFKQYISRWQRAVAEYELKPVEEAQDD